MKKILLGVAIAGLSAAALHRFAPKAKERCTARCSSGQACGPAGSR